MSGLPERFVPFASEENRIPIGTDLLICHGRTSTNSRGLDNVHPFQHSNLFLAHNGIVRWTGEKDKEPKPVCDSEQILHWLAQNNVDFNGLENVFAGFGAIALYDASTGILTVARDGASLYVARRSRGDGWVFATTLDIMHKVCRKARISIDTNPIVFPKCRMTFKGGTILTDDDWNGFGNRPWTAQDYVSYGTSGAVTTYKATAQESSVVFTREGKQVNQQGELVPLGTTTSVKKDIFPEEEYEDEDLDEDETEEGRFPDDTETFVEPDATVSTLPELEEDDNHEAFPDYYPKTKICKIKNAQSFFDDYEKGES